MWLCRKSMIFSIYLQEVAAERDVNYNTKKNLGWIKTTISKQKHLADNFVMI